MSDDEFRDLICENLACRLSDGEDCSKTMDHFLERCFYVPVRGCKPWYGYDGRTLSCCSINFQPRHDSGCLTCDMGSRHMFFPGESTDEHTGTEPTAHEVGLLQAREGIVDPGC